MRQTRHEYLAGRPTRQRRATRRDVALLLAKHVKRSLIAKKLIPDPASRPPRKTFGWFLPHAGEGVVRANTRGEARSLIKYILGVKNKRLPKEVQITEIVDADQRASA